MFNQMKRMGLNMHVGSGNKASKTEAIFFPSRSKISEWLRKEKKKIIFPSEEQSEIKHPSIKERENPYHVTKKALNKAYNNAYETNDIIVNDYLFVSFTHIFKYLGPWIYYDLYDTFSVESRISKANQAMRALIFSRIQMQ